MIKENVPIFITGCGRSGASMIAGLFNICGAFIGNVGEKNGHYENQSIISRLVNPYMLEMRYNLNHQFPLPDSKHMLIPSDWRERVLSLMKLDGYVSGPWIVKGAFLTTLWPIWRYAFPEAKWVFIRRRTGDVINSYTKTNYMTTFKRPENIAAVGGKTEHDGWAWLIKQYEARFIDIIDSGANYQIVWPERMAYHDYIQIRETIDWLGLSWSGAAFNFIDPKFRKTRIKEGISLEGV